MAVLTVPLFDADGKVDKLLGLNDFSVMNSTERRDLKGNI